MPEEEAPEQKARWFYAFEDGWQTFSDEDDEALEKRWELLEKEGLFAKIKREHQEEEKEREEEESRVKEEQEKEESREKEQGGGPSNAPTLPSPPSGVDQVKKGVLDAIGQGQENNSKEEDKTIVNEHLDPDEPEENRRFRVEVMEDHLFEVDLEKMHLFPVFWKGVLLKVVRATWFYSSLDTGGYAPIPYNEGLSQDLEVAYEKVKPWARSFDKKNESKKEEPEKDELYALPSMQSKGDVYFQDAASGRIFTQDFSGRFMSVLGGSLVIRGWTETVRRTNVSFLQRPFLPWAGGKEQGDATEDDGAGDSKKAQSKEGAAKAPHKAPASGGLSSVVGGQSDENKGNEGGFFRLWPSSDSILRPGVNLLRALGWSKEESAQEGQRAAKQKNTEKSLKNDESQENEDDEDIPNDFKDAPPELVLAIHGIGQKMVEEWDAIDFVYDVEKLRNLSKKVSSTAALRRVSRGRRAQYLPISWRKELTFDEEEAREGNDNVYTLQDVSNDASIPIVRNVISKVILDVPYYLSRHKIKMIDAVKEELNRVYRLFVRRNPDFEKKGGRVSLICHSLGSAIAADILSNQPTYVPPLSKQSKESLISNEHLLFNVKNLFFIGSPNGFFFHLEGAQMIARRGTARTRNVEEDAARDEVGRYGCMAAEAVYNCYNSTDPVAFQLSATVDAQYARIMKPISIPDAVPSLLEALSVPRLSLSKLFDPSHPFTRAGNPAYTMETKAIRASSSQQTSGVNTPKRELKGEEKSTIVIEKGSAQKENQIKSRLEKERESQRSGSKTSSSSSSKQVFDLERLQRAERRFRALNPHGCIDFIYDSGGYNQYFDMLSAHISYWQSNSFATFVLLQLFSDFEEKDKAPTIVPLLDPTIVTGKNQKDGKGSKEGKEGVDDDGDDDDDDDAGSNQSADEKKNSKGLLLSAIPLPGIM